MQKRCFRGWCCFLACVLCFLYGCGTEEEALHTLEWQEVKVSFIDVGKGDAILIETENCAMLIDAGYEKTSDTVLAYLDNQGINQLEYLVITHFDKDHVGGADHVLLNKEVKTVLQPDYQSDIKQYLEYCEALETKDITPELVTETMRFSLDGAEFLVYPPQQTYYQEEDNDFSLVISMTYHDNTLLFAGDCEEERLHELLSQDEFDLRHDLLKVPHHGKSEDNSGDFLREVKPQIAVITCSEEQPASDSIRIILKSLGADTYLTTDGTIVCVCDGNTLRVTQER